MPAYHFTTSWHLPWIIASGQLEQPKQKIADYPSPDFVWATTSPRGEMTATGRDAYRAGKVMLVRLTFDEGEFFPWAEALSRHPDWKPHHVERLERTARGQDTRQWLCRMGPLPINNASAIDARTYTSNTWRPVVDLEVREARRDSKTWLAMRLPGSVVASERSVTKNGGYGLQGGELESSFDELPLAKPIAAL